MTEVARVIENEIREYRQYILYDFEKKGFIQEVSDQMKYTENPQRAIKFSYESIQEVMQWVPNKESLIIFDMDYLSNL